MMTQMTTVQGMTDVLHGLLFALACGCRQLTGQIGREAGSGVDVNRSRGVGCRCTTLSSGQMLLPGIAEPYRWESGVNRQEAATRRG